MSLHQIEILSQPERIERIKTETRSTSEFEKFHDFRNNEIDLPVITLPISVLAYRMSNIRTDTKQEEYLQKHSKEDDFFLNGQENDEAQQIQHSFLDEFARKSSDSITSIRAALQEEGQRETLLITFDGVVVNGNRRLAAMRELQAEEPTKHNFNYVKCKVLPSSADEQDIEQIEIKLQMRPQTLLPYGWIDQVKAVKKLLEHGMDKSVLATLMRVRQIDLDMDVRVLNFVDDYLNNWIKRPKEYSLLENNEQFFRDFAKKTKNIDSEKLSVAKTIGFTMNQFSDDLSGRLYNYNDVFGNYLDHVAEKLAERRGVPLEVEVETDGEIFDFGEEGETEFSYQPLIEDITNACLNKDDGASIVSEISDIFWDKKDAEDNKQRANDALSKARQANTKLAAIDLSIAGESTYKAIENQFESISSTLKQLQERLGKLMKKIDE